MKDKYPEGIRVYIQKWRGVHKHISYTIVFHTSPSMENEENSNIYPNKGIWNSYIQIDKLSIPKEFDSLIPKLQKTKHGKHRDYYRLEKLFEFSGGITFYRTQYDEEGLIAGFEVGNDYNHIWNGGESIESILYDIKKSIDEFIDHFPKRKVWSIVDGKWVMPKNLETHNKKANEKLDKKYPKLASNN